MCISTAIGVVCCGGGDAVSLYQNVCTVFWAGN